MTLSHTGTSLSLQITVSTYLTGDFLTDNSPIHNGAHMWSIRSKLISSIFFFSQQIYKPFFFRKTYLNALNM